MMKYINGKFKRKICTVMVALFSLSVGCAVDADSNTNWKTECVGYYQFDLPGEAEVALVKPRALAPEMSHSKILTEITIEFKPRYLTEAPPWLRMNVPLPHDGGAPHVNWRIVVASTQGHALASESEIIARGETDTKGKLNLSKKEENRLLEVWARTPYRLWLVYPGEINQPLCINNPSRENENQSELPEHCQPLKMEDPLRFVDGSQPRYAVRGKKAYYPRLEILTRVSHDQNNYYQVQGTYQVTSLDALEVFEWLRRQATGKTALAVPENTLVNMDNDSGRVVIDALRAGRIYRYTISSSRNQENLPSPTWRATQFLKNFRVRAPFEVPHEPGVCIPHGFIADDGKTQRRMSVAFRLKKHPEVELFFMEGKMPRQADSAEGEIQMFWRSLYNTLMINIGINSDVMPTVTDISEDELQIKEIETIQIAGRNGKALFKKMFNRKDSLNFAYIAYASGYDLAAREMPELMFYLISGGEPATGTPISKKEVLAMAQRIVASIKRRVPD